jgi:hypothetical protein
MKQFNKTYLYIKTHNITGLKYFGKTTKDPYKYKGSGIYWTKHIKKYGYDVITEIIGIFEDRYECETIAISFSKSNDIVNSNLWANLIEENGLDGGDTGGSRTRNYKPMSDETKQKLSLSKKGKIPWNKGTKGLTPGNKNKMSDETKQKLRLANLGKKNSKEAVEKIRAKLKGRKRPDISIMLRGRIVSEETRLKISISQKGKTISEETRKKLSEANTGRIISEEIKEKLKGKVVVIDKSGNIIRIEKELYYSQTGPKESWEWIMHRCKEAQLRKEQAIESARMRR